MAAQITYAFITPAALRSAGRDERETTLVVQATQREVAALREAYLQRELGEFFGR